MIDSNINFIVATGVNEYFTNQHTFHIDKYCISYCLLASSIAKTPKTRRDIIHNHDYYYYH